MLLHRKHKATEARLLLERAVTHQRSALAREPRNTTSGQFLRNHYLLLAEILLSQRDHAALAARAAEAPGDYNDCEWHVWAVKTLVACARLARVDSSLSPTTREECADGYLDQARGFLLGAAKHAQTPDECRGVFWALTKHPEMALHDADRAVKVMEKAVQAHPDDHSCRGTLGKAYYRAGRFDEAIGQLEKSNELVSDSSSSNWFYLAMAHWQRGHKEEARSCFDEGDRLLEQNPQSGKQVYRLRAEAARLLGIGTASAEEEDDVEEECDEWPSIDR
jgi:tetratricopeptide (TPR) repeat protein